MLANGTISAGVFEDNTAPAPEENSSFSKWLSNLNSSISSFGAYVSDFKFYNFKINQSNISTINYSFNIYLSLKDRSVTTAVSRTYNISGVADVTGLVDPAVVRASNKLTSSEQEIQRQFFFASAYDEPSDLNPQNLATKSSLLQGQGWFYGPLVPVKDAAKITSSERHAYIVYGTYQEIIQMINPTYSEFGAIILTNLPTSKGTCTNSGNPATVYENEENTFFKLTYQKDSSGICKPQLNCGTSDCPDRPYIVYYGFSESTIKESCPDFAAGSGSKKCVLFATSYSQQQVHATPELKKYPLQYGGGLYSLEKLRDFVGCGYYTNSKNASSYMQRLFSDAYSRNSTLGIETFVVGEYANHTAYKGYSSLDKELFNKITGVEVRGMPGCKSRDMCASDPSTGKFSLSTTALTNYLGSASDIACSSKLAGCK
jgi:hypothetical protein